MNLKSKALLLLTPVIIIPILMLGAVSANKLREATQARLNASVTTLLNQISRHSFEAEFIEKQGATNHDTLVDLYSLENVVNNNSIGETGYLLVIEASGEILFLPENISIPSAKNNLRLLGEKTSMEESKTQTEIDVDGNIVFTYWEKLPSGMNVVAFLPKDDVINAGCELTRPVYAMSVVIALFVVISVLMFLRYWVTKPLDALNSAAKEISNGNMDVDINIDRKDEIGLISKSFYDTSKNLKQTHEEANYIANHDSLTGLPNRNLFNDYLENIIAIARTKQHSVALLFIVLDNLAQINESHGQEGGDAALKEMASRLNNDLRKHQNGDSDLHDKSYDIVSRYGGDEFIVLLDKIDGAWDSAVVSDRILKSLREPVLFNNEQIQLICNIGATVYPNDSLSAQELIKNADIAMYRAKKHGSNNYQFFSDDTNTEMHRHLRIHSRLRNAIDNDQFFMDYQPKFDVISNDIAGIEALIRWQDPEDGLISPDDFLCVAEDSGLLSEITKWSIKHVCQQGMDWYSSGRLTMPIAVNLSAIEFKRFDLLAVISHSLEESGLPAEFLELELNETVLLAGTDETIEILSSLKKLGVRISLNSYGMSCSSLSYLKKLPIDTLKIDRSFVAEIDSLQDTNTIIDVIIALGHAMGLTVAAVGVETNIQGEFLKIKGCDVMQGYQFCKPLSADDMALKIDVAQVADE